MKINIVIPSKNGLHHLKDCLPGIITAAKKSAAQIRIIVVDDHSSDGTLSAAPALFPEVTFLQNPKQGACSARNFGVKHAPCDWICFLDNDVFVDEDFFNTSQQYLRPDVFCVTCAGYAAFPKTAGAWEQIDGLKLLEWKRGFLRFTGNIFNRELPPQDEYLSWGVQGAYFWCSRARFDELNGFDEHLDPYMLEESDLIYRGLKQDWKITYAPDTKLRHKCGGTIASKTNKYTKFLSKRNRIFFVWKNIHERSLLSAHIAWTLFNLKIKPVWKALPLIKQSWPARKRERLRCKVKDSEILARQQRYVQTLRRLSPDAAADTAEQLLDAKKEIDFLSKTLHTYSRRYRSSGKILTHLIWACTKELLRRQHKKKRTDGRLRIKITLSGGLGDLLIGLNFLCYLYQDTFARYNPVIELKASNQSILQTFLPPWAAITPKDRAAAYDLELQLDRTLSVCEADTKNLQKYPEAEGLVRDILRFEREYREFLSVSVYQDSLSNNIPFCPKLRWAQPDVWNKYHLREEFILPVRLPDENNILNKYGLTAGKYITLNNEAGLDKTHANTKSWDPRSFQTLAKLLRREFPGYKLVQLGLNTNVHLDADLNLSAQTSLAELCAVLKNSRLHIGSEGGLIHLRHALKGGASCVLFGPTSPENYGYSENLNLHLPQCPKPCEQISKYWKTACLYGGNVCKGLHALTPGYVLDKIKEHCLL